MIPTNKPNAQLLTLRQVAQILQITPRGVRDLVSRQKIPRPIKVGRLLRWPEETVTAWISRQQEAQR